MKLIKAMKQLKFWSRNKRRKKKFNHYKLADEQCYPPNLNMTPHFKVSRYANDDYLYNNPPPPPARLAPTRPALEPAVCQCHFCGTVEPSAPPLPPWLEPQKSGQMSYPGSSDWSDPFVGLDQQGFGEDYVISVCQEIVVKTSSGMQERPAVNDVSSSAYQQCMMSNSPAHDLQKREQAAEGKMFGCVIDVGAYLFRCFFPCFRISEHRLDHYDYSGDYHRLLADERGQKSM